MPRPSDPDPTPDLPEPAAALPVAAKKPRSVAQREAARRNGAKSKGPVTVEGRKRSSMNALRHGCAGGPFVLLACEDHDAFRQLAVGFENGLGAIGEAEKPLLGRMVRAEWRFRRLERIETEFMEQAIRAADADGADPFAFLDSPRLRTLMRYMAHQRAELHRAHDAILRQRAAHERTERHDRAMLQAGGSRGRWYYPAGRHHVPPEPPPFAINDDDPPRWRQPAPAAPAGDVSGECRNEPGPVPGPPTLSERVTAEIAARRALLRTRNKLGTRLYTPPEAILPAVPPGPAAMPAPAAEPVPPQAPSAAPAPPAWLPELLPLDAPLEELQAAARQAAEAYGFGPPDLSPHQPGEPNLPPPLLALWRDPARQRLGFDELQKVNAFAWQAWDADEDTARAWILGEGRVES
jgi:hypothetical protein